MNETHLPILKDDPNITTVTIALNYLCNSRCRFCFIERELDMKLPDTSEAIEPESRVPYVRYQQDL